jgi:predicted nuclease of restriction endonuclease-like (RecB) superfamily
MIRFAETFDDPKIIQVLAGHLSWSQLVEIIYLDDELKRNFYSEMCRLEGWDVRTLRKKVDGMLFERTAIAKKPAELMKRELKTRKEKGRLTPDLVFRDPYVLDFLRLQGSYNEKDVETAILRELEEFILELGVGFSFVTRQKRMTIDHEDYYLDLLFYHRKLMRMVAVELKLGRFRAADKGQMELYLRWLDKYERQPGEKSPIGLILCARKSDEQVELLQLGKSGIRVAQYLTELPPRKMFEKKLHEAIRSAQERATIAQGKNR